MGEEDTERTDAQRTLEVAWYAVVMELTDIVMDSESTESKIAAGDVLLKYFIAMGQSINEPFLPKGEFTPEEDDDDE
jgi:hypothetical protein